MEGNTLYIRLYRKCAKGMGVTAVLLLLLGVPAAIMAQGSPEKGREIYSKRCWWCHGEKGAGDGPAAELLNPPPRDFTTGMYKFKSTPFDELVPSDDDFYKMIKGEMTKNSIPGWTGMNDTSMVGWGDKLKDQDIWDLIAYIKTFSGIKKPEKMPVTIGSKVSSSKESIAKGKELFKEMCSECHGKEGRGDGKKMLNDDWGHRTWPRNLTKGWTFRVSNNPEDIAIRVAVGITGTQMPSFLDPASKKRLSEEDIWHVANYVNSLDAPYKKPSGTTVITALPIDGEVPEKVDDERWGEAEYMSFYMIPQIIAKERHFKPSINSISVKAVYNDKDIALLLEWDDRTKSIPGDPKAAEIAGSKVFKDAVSVQLPVEIPEGREIPYFGMGDTAKPVNIWFWQSESTEESQLLKLINAKGFKNKEERNPAEADLKAAAVYDNGTWRVVMKRPISTDKKDKDIQIVKDKFIPIAFAVWDGSNGEIGSKHEMTTWYWLFLKPKTGTSIYLIPLFVGALVFGAEILWIKRARKEQKPDFHRRVAENAKKI